MLTASQAGECVRVMGSGHSSHDISFCGDHVVSLALYNRIVELDGDSVRKHKPVDQLTTQQDLSRKHKPVDQNILSSNFPSSAGHSPGRLHHQGPHFALERAQSRARKSRVCFANFQIMHPDTCCLSNVLPVFFSSYSAICEQAIAGAVSTATHGTGRELGSLADQVLLLKLG